MSWSVSAIGKARAVERAIREQFDNAAACREPEEQARQSAKQAIGWTLAAYPDEAALKVTANGSMSSNNGVPQGASLHIAVEQIYGWAE